MLETSSPLTLVDLLSQEIHLTPDEALAMGCAVCDLTARTRQEDGVVFMPRVDGIRLDLSGSILTGQTEPLSEAEAIRRIAELLERLLPPVGSEVRVPAPVRYALARARADLDVPPYRTLDDLARAVGRFQVCDPRAALRTLAARCTEPADAVESPPLRNDGEPELTVSDLRRWRRAASRVSLQHIAYRIGVPHSLLRELEWGYFANWPAAPFAERCLRAYAREARMDPDVVLRVVLPLLPKADRRPPKSSTPAPLVWWPRLRYAAAAAGLLLAIVGGEPAPKPVAGTARAQPAPSERTIVLSQMQPPKLVVQPVPAAMSALSDANDVVRKGARARVRGGSVRRAKASRAAPKWARELGRLLAGDGRYKVKPIPRPSAAGG